MLAYWILVVGSWIKTLDKLR